MFKKILAVLQVFVLLVAPLTTYGIDIPGPNPEPTIVLENSQANGQQYGFPDFTISVVENQILVSQIILQNSTGGVVDVYLDKNIDDSAFEIIGSELVFKENPDFENPIDDEEGGANAKGGSAQDDIYRIGLRYDVPNGDTIGINVQVEVTNVDEVPTIAFGNGEDLEFTAKKPTKFLEQLEVIDSNYTIEYTGGDNVDLVVIFTAPDNNSPLKPFFLKHTLYFPTPNQFKRCSSMNLQGTLQQQEHTFIQ